MNIFKVCALLFPLLSFSQEFQEKFLEDDCFLNKNVFFLHIPKTAGTSTIHFFIKNIGLKGHRINSKQKGNFDVSPRYPNDPYILPQLAKLLKPSKSYTFYSSHIPFFYLKNSSSKALVFTILRNPVKRQISMIKYHHLMGTIDKVENVAKNVLKLSSTYNFQTLYLSSLNPFDLTVDMQDHLQSAMHNLQYNLDFFGLTEYLQDSLDELTKKMHLYNGQKVPQDNTTYNKPNLNFSFDEEKLRQENWADIELYKFAKELFLQRFPHLKR
jgi:hypothetical protein